MFPGCADETKPRVCNNAISPSCALAKGHSSVLPVQKWHETCETWVQNSDLVVHTAQRACTTITGLILVRSAVPSKRNWCALEPMCVCSQNESKCVRLPSKRICGRRNAMCVVENALGDLQTYCHPNALKRRPNSKHVTMSSTLVQRQDPKTHMSTRTCARWHARVRACV